MKSFQTSLLLFVTVLSVSAAPNSPISKRDVDPALVPDFGHKAGLNPTGTGDCDGITNAAGAVVKIPCICPPPRSDFIKALNANVAAGRAVNNTAVAVSFPTGNDKASKLARMNAAIVTLQNLRGPGVGCPTASTTFSAQLKAIQAGTNTPVSSSPSPPAPILPVQSSPLPTPTASGNVDPALVPEFGVQPGVNPTGNGDCDGIENAAGQAIKIPCTCPPDRSDFIKLLSANVAAGHAINNTGIVVSFPTGNGKAPKIARMNAAIVTLQNLRGPGVGCPAASTTFSAQLKAIQGGTDSPVAASPSPPAPVLRASRSLTPKSSAGVDPALVPEFGVQPGVNPTGSGDCDGIEDAAGQAIKIPCNCPPDRTDFIKSLSANVAAVNNPSMAVSFPTGNDKASKFARINAAIVTLQNLRGPGAGCPAASTTFGAAILQSQE